MFRRHARILYPSAVNVTIRAVGQYAPHYRRNGIHHVAKLRFLFPDHRFCTNPLGDIGHRPDKLAIAWCILYGLHPPAPNRQWGRGEWGLKRKQKTISGEEDGSCGDAKIRDIEVKNVGLRYGANYSSGYVPGRRVQN